MKKHFIPVLIGFILFAGAFTDQKAQNYNDSRKYNYKSHHKTPGIDEMSGLYKRYERVLPGRVYRKLRKYRRKIQKYIFKINKIKRKMNRWNISGYRYGKYLRRMHNYRRKIRKLELKIRYLKRRYYYRR